MNEDRLREWLDWQLPFIEAKANSNCAVRYHAKYILALATAYRQLEKDNADQVASNQERAKALTTMLAREKEFREAKTELLSALKPFAESLSPPPPSISDIVKAREVYTKHSTDINRFETLDGMPIDKLDSTDTEGE